MSTSYDDDYEVEEATLNASHETLARSWEALQEVPQGNSAYLLMLVGPNAPRMYPVGSEVTVGRSTASGISIDDESVSRNHARITMRGGSEFVVEDLGSRNGTRVNGEAVNAHPLQSGDRLQFGSSTIFLVTYHTRLEDQLLEVRKLESEGRLASGLALNCRSILKPMHQHLETLQEQIEKQPIDTAKLRQSLAEISRAARRADALGQQLLTFARTGDYREQPVLLSELLRDTVRMIPQPIDRSINHANELESDLWVLGDPMQLRTMVTHLCDNAVDAMPGGGTLRVAAQRVELSSEKAAECPLLAGETTVAEISVTDSGVGMHPEVVRRVFEPFYSTKPTREGAGLGLAICDRIVKSHRGHIDVDTAVGQGTTIRILMPLAPANPTLQ